MILFARLLFIAIIGLELLGLLGILPLTPQFSWAGLVLTALFSLGALGYMENRLGGRYRPPLYLWITVIAAIVLDAGGDIMHLYARFPWYDNLTHFTGGLATGIAVRWFVGMKEESAGKTAPFTVRFYLILTAVASTAVLYEMMEYFSDWFLGTAALADRWDTTEDIIMTVLGGLIPSVMPPRKRN